MRGNLVNINIKLLPQSVVNEFKEGLTNELDKMHIDQVISVLEGDSEAEQDFKLKK